MVGGGGGGRGRRVVGISKNPGLPLSNSGFVSEMRLELTRSNDHYPLKVARLPIPPSGHLVSWALRLATA